MLATVLMFTMTAFQPQTRSHAILKPEDQPVSLTGQIRFLHGYGPPGWGEDPKHDARITYWVIDLPVAINTPCKPERPEWAATECRSAKRLRLIIENNDQLVTQAKALSGRKAIVKGVLRRQDTAGEMTPLYVDVTDIQSMPPPAHQ
jgi:hypothetical protein